MADQFPGEFGKYKIIEEVGRGGFAAVYKAVDTTLDRTVALKVLAPHLLWDPAFVQRFQREAKLAANLKHPNVVIIHQFGQEAGTIYIAMEFLVGQTLKEVILEEGALPPAHIVNIVEQVASALDYAHGRELVHRDIKPSNIMVGADDHVTVMDFGIAKAATQTALTTTGRIFGTPEYMSPEQAEGVEEPDARSDIYSLGVVVYEMFTGKVPFSGTTPLSIMRGHTDKSPPLPSEINPDVSPAVQALLLKALAKKREERYQSAGEMAVAFQQAVSGPVVEEIKKLPPEPEAELRPSLVSFLSVEPQIIDVDGEAKWTFRLHNNGDDDLRQVTVRRGRTLLDEPFDLAAGKERRFTFTTTYKAKGEKSERVTTTGIASNGESVRDEASATVQVRQPRKPEPELHPSLALKLSVKPQTVDAGGEATWTVTLRNDGDDDLRHVTVQHGSRGLEAPFVLAVGKERRFTFTTTYKTEGRKTERVTVSGIASSGKSVRDEASATVQARPPRPVTPKPEPVPKPKPPAKPAPDVLTITSPIHLELVRVRAGEFLMGSDPAKDRHAKDDEQPQHRVYVSEFYIGKHPVTNAQYAVFAKATKRKAPQHWKGGKIPSGKENHPVVWVSWDDAVAFCQWLSQETGKQFRLPTEAEWEKAARGTDGRIYPWGNEWDESRANVGKFGRGLVSLVSEAAIATTPVGQYSPRGDSPYGAADMAGNVEEWCSDWYDEQEYQRRAKSTVKDPPGPKKGANRVLRGGSWNFNRGDARCAARYRLGQFHSIGNFGFRLVSPVLF